MFEIYLTGVVGNVIVNMSHSNVFQSAVVRPCMHSGCNRMAYFDGVYVEDGIFPSQNLILMYLVGKKALDFGDRPTSCLLPTSCTV